MNRSLIIAAAELRLMLRSRLALVGVVTLLLLSAIAAVTSAVQMAETAQARAQAQAETDEQFKAQPNRHPHRMVHYGTYALRPVGPLAAFDPGVDSFTGTVVFLEGHRQNSATFGAARESSDLLRFGQLTPAFVLQTLAPLLLIFLGFASVARERQPHEGGIALVIALAYAGYLAAWVLGIVAVSGIARTSQGALIALIAAWALIVVLVPRAAAGIAGVADPLPSRVDTELAIAADLRRIGDSHNPDDPHFAAFKAKTLKKYGVSRTEDLPFNYRGYVAQEGERITSQLFKEYAARADAIRERQSAWLGWVGVLSPALSVRNASMVGAATDLTTHTAFMNAAEAYRFDLVQRLNGLQATAVSGADDAARSKDPLADQRTRISADFWKTMPEFEFNAPSPSTRMASMLPSLLLLGLWIALAFGVLGWAVRQMERHGA